MKDDDINGEEDSFSEKADFKELFTGILGAEINIKDNLNKNEEIIFTHFVNILSAQQIKEEKLYEVSGIEMFTYTDPLWNVIEDILKLLYGEGETELIMWYILDRISPDGSIAYLEDENEKKYTLLTPKDLWSYINHRYPKDN